MADATDSRNLDLLHSQVMMIDLVLSLEKGLQSIYQMKNPRSKDQEAGWTRVCLPHAGCSPARAHTALPQPSPATHLRWHGRGSPYPHLTDEKTVTQRGE